MSGMGLHTRAHVHGTPLFYISGTAEHVNLLARCSPTKASYWLYQLYFSSFLDIAKDHLVFFHPCIVLTAHVGFLFKQAASILLGRFRLFQQSIGRSKSGLLRFRSDRCYDDCVVWSISGPQKNTDHRSPRLPAVPLGSGAMTPVTSSGVIR